MLCRVRIPQLLQANPVVLRAAGEPEPGDQLLAEMAAAAFGEKGVFRTQGVTGLKGRLELAGCGDAHIPRQYAGDPAFLVEHMRGGEAREDVHVHRFRLLAQPPA